MSNARGFTLIEMIISTAVLALFLVFSFSAMRAMSGAALAGTATTQAAVENQRVIQRINRDLLQADMARVTVTPTTLSLQRIVGFDDVAGEEIWSGTISYSRNGQNQVIRTENGVARIIGTGVTALSFTGSVTDVTVSATTGSGRGTNNTDSQMTHSVTVRPKNG